tara:strand:+ start:312 stop:500 length:189 start_codon:yes stop_codon:yes gene_type:complete
MKFNHRLTKDLDVPHLGRNFKKGFIVAVTDKPEKLPQYVVHGEDKKWIIVNADHIRMEACAD